MTEHSDSSRPQVIIICGTQRCGSTMVCEDLASTGVLGKPEEHFLSWIPRQDADWEAEFRVAKAKGSTPNGISAHKMMANQLRNVDGCMATFLKPAPAAAFPHLMAAFPDALWIWIRRRDALGQALSHIVAKTTGVFHAVKRTSGFLPGSAMTEVGLQNRTFDVPYDFQAIMQEWHLINRGNLAWQAFFELNGIAPVCLEYEVASTPDGRHAYVHDVADRLDVKIDVMGERNLSKLNHGISRQLRSRALKDLLGRV